MAVTDSKVAVGETINFRRVSYNRLNNKIGRYVGLDSVSLNVTYYSYFITFKNESMIVFLNNSRF